MIIAIAFVIIVIMHFPSLWDFNSYKKYWGGAHNKVLQVIFMVVLLREYTKED